MKKIRCKNEYRERRSSTAGCRFGQECTIASGEASKVPRTNCPCPLCNPTCHGFSRAMILARLRDARILLQLDYGPSFNLMSCGCGLLHEFPILRLRARSGRAFAVSRLITIHTPIGKNKPCCLSSPFRKRSKPGVSAMARPDPCWPCRRTGLRPCPGRGSSWTDPFGVQTYVLHTTRMTGLRTYIEPPPPGLDYLCMQSRGVAGPWKGRKPLEVHLIWNTINHRKSHPCPLCMREGSGK
ncbi:hypothetical protein V8F33_002106 [Rhypophila sp. PSN 637]